jgi:signal transduction histidine kinase
LHEDEGLKAVQDQESADNGIGTISMENGGNRQSMTELMSSEERGHLLQKMESLGILAGGVAHDFNNLLMGVLGNADLALSVMAPDAAGRNQVQDIIIAARRAADLANQMLAYSGRGRFKIERVDIGPLVADTVHLLRAAVSSSVVLQVEPNHKVSMVSVDVAQIRQVLLNLVANASEAIRERSGLIRITTGERVFNQDDLDRMYVPHELQPGPMVFIEVSDTGCGIEPETLRRIFDPFYTTKFTGRGLGLAAVLGIVRGHGGGIDVRSEGRRGSTFSIILPRSDTLRDETSREQSDEHLVLIIDDEETVREVTRAYLEQAGFAVASAEDGLRGLEVFRKRPEQFECIILDYTMPGMGGSETLIEIRKIRSDLPVIMSSGYDEDEVVRHIGNDSLTRFIQKPYGAAALLKRLAALGVTSR